MWVETCFGRWPQTTSGDLRRSRNIGKVAGLEFLEEANLPTPKVMGKERVLTVLEARRCIMAVMSAFSLFNWQQFPVILAAN